MEKTKKKWHQMQFFANNFLNNGPIRTKPTSINSYRCTEQEYEIKFQKKIKKKRATLT